MDVFKQPIFSPFDSLVSAWIPPFSKPLVQMVAYPAVTRSIASQGLMDEWSIVDDFGLVKKMCIIMVYGIL